jgi:hypothetical protein
MFNFIDGLLMVTDMSYFEQVAGNDVQLPATDNVDTWGPDWHRRWCVMVRQFRDPSGCDVGRFVGVVVASLGAVLQVVFLAHFPFRSLTMVLVDVAAEPTSICGVRARQK